MKKKLLIISVILIISIPFLIWAGALLRGEVLTALYLDEFDGMIEENEDLAYWVEGYNTVKVLSYSKEKAELYYIISGKMGNIVSFSKADGKWQTESINTRWSTQDNADETVFPYCRLIFN